VLADLYPAVRSVDLDFVVVDSVADLAVVPHPVYLADLGSYHFRFVAVVAAAFVLVE